MTDDVSKMRWYHYRDDDDWIDNQDFDDAIDEYACSQLSPGDEIPETLTIYEFGTDGTLWQDDDRDGYELHVIKEHGVDLHQWMRENDPDMIVVGSDGLARVPK